MDKLLKFSLGVSGFHDSQNLSPKVLYRMDRLGKQLTETPRIKAFWPEPVESNSQLMEAKEKLGIVPIGVPVYEPGNQDIDKAVFQHVGRAEGEGKTQVYMIAATDKGYRNATLSFRIDNSVSVGFGNYMQTTMYVKCFDFFIDIDTGWIHTSVSMKFGPRVTIELLHILRKAINDIKDENGWAKLHLVGEILSNYAPDWRAVTGYEKLLPLMQSMGCYHFRENGSVVFVRELF
jgi:hypothetical protein